MNKKGELRARLFYYRPCSADLEHSCATRRHPGPAAGKSVVALRPAYTQAGVRQNQAQCFYLTVDIRQSSATTTYGKSGGSPAYARPPTAMARQAGRCSLPAWRGYARSFAPHSAENIRLRKAE